MTGALNEGPSFALLQDIPTFSIALGPTFPLWDTSTWFFFFVKSLF